MALPAFGLSDLEKSGRNLLAVPATENRARFLPWYSRQVEQVWEILVSNLAFAIEKAMMHEL